MKNVRTSFVLCVAVFCHILAPSHSFAQQPGKLVEWLFELSGGIGTLSPTYIDSAVYASPVAYSGVFTPASGPYVAGVSGSSLDRAFIMRGWPTSIIWDPGDYFEFSITVDSGEVVSVDSISLQVNSSVGPTGPTVLHLRKSQDYFANPLDTMVPFAGWNKWSLPVTFSDLHGPALVRYRIYGNGSGGSNGTLSVDSIKIFGTALSVVRVQARIFLQGPYVDSLGLMSDALRVEGLIPLFEPYGGLGFSLTNGEFLDPLVLSTSGPNAIVDWVLLELRSSEDSSTVVGRRSGLVQRDGDVVDIDGISPISFGIPEGD